MKRKIFSYVLVFVFAFVLTAQITPKTVHAALALPQCQDGLDNDGDGVIDNSDPQCHTDGDLLNAFSYDANIDNEASPIANTGCTVNCGGGGGGGNHLCADNLDNDSDGFVDAKDPGCHSDFDASNPASYNPNDDDETNPAPASAPFPIIIPPVGQVLGVSTERPLVLQKTGGVKVFAHLKDNLKAVALAMKENDRLVIPKIHVDKPILKLNNINALRFEAMIAPYGVAPGQNGNTILTGHSYNSLGGKLSKSTFYDLDKLNKGDEIKVVWQGKNYTYLVSEKGTVKPTDTKIEDQTTSPILTLYGCGHFDNTVRNYIKADLQPEKLAKL